MAENNFMQFDLISVGINHYPHLSGMNSLGDLDYAAFDAYRFSSTLKQLGMAITCQVLSDELGDRMPSRNELYRVVRACRRHPNRPKIFFFAGHGVSIDGNLHLCPCDFDDEIADKSSIKISEIVDELSHSSPWALLIVDCCRSPLLGTGDRNPSSALQPSAVHVSENTLVVHACSNGERSLEAAVIDGGGTGGVFTHFLIDSIRNASRSRRRKFVSVLEVFSRARNATSDYVLLCSGKSQTPTMIGAQGGDFFLLKRDG